MQQSAADGEDAWGPSQGELRHLVPKRGDVLEPRDAKLKQTGATRSPSIRLLLDFLLRGPGAQVVECSQHPELEEGVQDGVLAEHVPQQLETTLTGRGEVKVSLSIGIELHIRLSPDFANQVHRPISAIVGS